jgi:hypothetical protein
MTSSKPRGLFPTVLHPSLFEMSAQKPSHWPTDVQYINYSRYHSSVPSTTRAYIQGTGTVKPHPVVKTVVIRHIQSESHPACGQYGLFAAKKIPPKTHIIDYIGEVHCDDRPDSDYDLSLYRTQDGVNVGVDAKVMGNEARFINDFRGVRSKPNAKFVDGVSRELRMSVWSAEEVVKKGEEILVSYGKSWWRSR